MADTQFRNNAIRKLIHDATTVHDLIPMLHLIELHTLQDLIHQQLEKMDALETSHLFCSSLPMERIFPTDIIAHITSFYNMSEIRLVSTTFNKCYESNKKQEWKPRETQIISKIQTDTNTNRTTWVVDPTRKELNQNEIQLNYSGPIRDVVTAIQNANHGDTILIYDGVYGDYDPDRFVSDFHDEDAKKRMTFNIDKRLQIIGIGDVVIEYNLIKVMNHVYFKNITFNIQESLELSVGYSLFMYRCVIKFSFDGLCVADHCVLDVYDCVFDGHVGDTDRGFEAIRIAENTKSVSSTHCVFTGCGGDCGVSCIGFSAASLDNYPGTTKLNAELTLIDNLFCKNGGMAIGANTNINHHKIWSPHKVNVAANRSDFRDIMEYFIDSSIKPFQSKQ
eukprot:420499_1